MKLKEAIEGLESVSEEWLEEHDTAIVFSDTEDESEIRVYWSDILDSDRWAISCADKDPEFIKACESLMGKMKSGDTVTSDG